VHCHGHRECERDSAVVGKAWEIEPVELIDRCMQRSG
jgi:hypothetical protein